MIPLIVNGGRSPGAVDRPLPVEVLESELTWDSLFAPAGGSAPRPGEGPAIHVGIVDTGITVDDDGRPHPYLADALDPDWKDQVDRPGNTTRRRPDTDGHGSFVAGLIHAAAPDARLHMRRALDVDDDRRADAAVAEQLWSLAAVPGLSVINLSFFGDDRTRPEGILDALRGVLADGPDLHVVIAAGNIWTGEPIYPAAFAEDLDRVVVVGAIDGSVRAVPGLRPPRASFSSYRKDVTLYAPGVQVRGPYTWTVPDGPLHGWASWSGTSFAAATVSGLLARRAAMGVSVARALSGFTQTERMFEPVPGAPAKPYLARA